MEHARTMKCADELRAMRRAVAACEAAMGVMEQALKPGMTENDLWASCIAATSRAAASGSRRGCWRPARGPIPGSRNARRG